MAPNINPFKTLGPSQILLIKITLFYSHILGHFRPCILMSNQYQRQPINHTYGCLNKSFFCGYSLKIKIEAKSPLLYQLIGILDELIQSCVFTYLGSVSQNKSFHFFHKCSYSVQYRSSVVKHDCVRSSENLMLVHNKVKYFKHINLDFHM